MTGARSRRSDFRLRGAEAARTRRSPHQPPFNQRVDSTFTQNGWGRPTVMQWGGLGCPIPRGNQFYYMYSYTPAGLVASKRLRLARNVAANGYPTSWLSFDLDVAYAYNNEGRQTSITYPTTWTLDSYDNPVAHPGPIYTYSFDFMNRPIGL